MRNKYKKTDMRKKIRKILSPWTMLGVVMIFTPVFTFMTLERLEKQKQFFHKRLKEKGLSLIRTFEAGTRIGMITMKWGAHRTQAMLMETALQPDVEYMMITTVSGEILVHSDRLEMGKIYENMPDISDLGLESNNAGQYRIRNGKNNENVFEVYKRFVPVRPHHKPKRRHMHTMRRFDPIEDKRKQPKETDDWILSYLDISIAKYPRDPEHYIFAGLSMEKERTANTKLFKETIRRGVFFFVLCCAGVALLFSFQSYQTAKASLFRVKAFSDKVIQTMPAGLMTLNGQQTVTSMNDAAKKILEKDDHDTVLLFKEIIDELNDKGGMIQREISLPERDSTIKYLDLTAAVLVEEETNDPQYIFLFRDISQIAQLKKQVETNKRLAAIGKFAAGVAHEIRNPLSSIKGFATYFGKRYEKHAKDKETALIMVREIERMDRSISQLLEFAKPLEIRKKDVDLQTLMAHSLKLVENDMAVKNISASLNCADCPATIFTDGDRLNQVLLNLYINAIHAMGKNGRLDILVTAEKPGDEIRIDVRDTGKGIEASSLELIFDPYFTTRSTGTGLGLFIVHRIIENLGGQIFLESKIGEGTCFSIILPIS